MKHRLLVLFFLLSPLTVLAEQSYTLWNTLDSDKDYHYTANSHIILSDGFKAQPKEGHEVLLDIDAYGIFPPESGITGGTPQNNTGGVVGSLGGLVDVSLLGGAIYTIPIELPTGLGGMKPQLSINYNSQSRNGLLGWGWDLSGTSSITRTGGTLYHDGYISGTTFTNDRFCLDGERLMQVTPGNYGNDGVSYRTEQDQMSKIVSYCESGINGPAYFKVWTAEGNLLYYGNTIQSRAFISQQNEIGIWLLSRVEDRNGNHMDYHYTIGPHGYTLDEIVYSGNDYERICPTFTVEFHYSNRDDVELSMVGHLVCQMDKKLDEIVVRSGASVMYSYQFIYKNPTPKNGLPYHLLSEVRFEAGQEHLNPTRIQWANNNYNSISSDQLKYQVTTTGIPNAFVNAVKYSGDFNGDGYSDIITLQPNEEGRYATAHIFVNKGINGNLTFDFVQSINLSPNISWIQVADFNGDGYDDILLSNRIRNGFPFPDQIDAEIYLCDMFPFGGFGFDKQVTPLCFIPRNWEEAHLVGDFFGDGKNAILVQPVNSNGQALETAQIFCFDEETGEIQLHEFEGNLNGTRLFTSDFDGDGTTEILYKKADHTTSIVKLEKTGNSFSFNEFYNAALEDWNDCFPGDFNGDGLTDILLFTENNPQPWIIHLSQGGHFYPNGFPLSPTFPYSSPGDYLFSLDQPNHSSEYIKIGDFDGNGCSDLALYKNNLFYVFYGPLNDKNADAPFTNCQKISVQAFGLYDNMNVCLGNFLGQDRLAFLGPNTLSRLPSMRLRHEVKKITDGMGRKTEFDYDYLAPNLANPSDNDFYQLTATGLDHFFNLYYIAIPMRGLKKVTTYNVKGKPIEMKCFYEDALLHRDGKGVLGFSRTRQDDYCDGQLQKKTKKEYTIEYTDDVIHLALSEEKVLAPTGHLMARSTYFNQLYSHLHNDKVYILLADKHAEEFDVDYPEQLTKKNIYNTTIATNCNQSHKYDGAISVTHQINGTTSQSDISLASACEFQEITLTEYKPNNYNTWLINRPSTITQTVHREGNYEDICHQQIFSYFANNPHRVKSILELPNNGNHPEDRMAKKTEIQYDATGNITSKTISTPNDTVTPRQERFEYSKAYGGYFLTKHTDALGHETHYEYDSVYHYCTSITDCNGLQTRFEQDPLGMTCMTYYPDGTQHCKALRWANESFYQWEKKSGQETKLNLFAFTGEPIGTKSYDLQGDLVFTSIEYDHFGRIQKKILPHYLSKDAQAILYQYDAHNRVTHIHHPDNSYEILQYDTNNKSTSYVTTEGDTQSESKTFNVMGWVIKSTDTEGSNIVYDYQADGKPISAHIEGHDETHIEMAYDPMGNRIRLNDPNYGLITCEYNAFNELVRQVTPKLDETTFHYDALGRMVKRIEKNHENNSQEITQWHYGTEPGELGLLVGIDAPLQTIQHQYDSLLRLKHTIETIDGIAYHSKYTYDPASRIASIHYPSDYTVLYDYTSEGYLRTLMDMESSLLWKTAEANAMMQPTKTITGNGFVTQYDYNIHSNRLRSIQTKKGNSTIQDYSYTYDHFDNMTERMDLKNATKESFVYDALNRLTNIEDQHGISMFTYDPLGRMTSKTTPEGIVFSDANYSGARPHAIKSVHAPHEVFPQEKINIEYNTFDKAIAITEGSRSIHLDYGYQRQRIHMVEEIDGERRTKTYVNHCEFVDDKGVNSVRTFLSGPGGVFAIAETLNGTTKVHYIHKDHCGSWTVISDSYGNIEQENHFDAWGLCQDPDHLMFDRGFTGHEHIRGVNLINMNGRIYDPLTSSMLSPDNNIQMPDFSQNFNRYAYCLNNPLMYTDPDGNTSFESIVMFYFLYCTDFGYEFQKYTKFIALHFDLHLSTQQLGIGVDASFGIPKSCYVSYRTHVGASYYCNFYDNSYRGFEFRVGSEWCLNGCIGYSGTSFYQRNRTQTTNSIILGTYFCNFAYENDYMFNLGKYIPFVPAADNGDRYRSAAARFRFGILSIGVNIYTGDPGMDHDVRNVFEDPERNGRNTYTISDNGDNPDEYRAGIFYVGVGPFKIGVNSEKVRDLFQNRFAHDFLCQKDSPYFKVLDRPNNTYFYFGTESGNTLW